MLQTVLRAFFCSAVFEKLARTHTPILTYWCPVPLVYLHVTPSKLAILDSVVNSLDWSDNGDCRHIYFSGHFGHFGHLVRYLDVGLSPRRVNRFLFCFLI